MSTKAEAVLKEIRALPLDEQEQVRDEILKLPDRQQLWEKQKADRLAASRSRKGVKYPG